MNNPRDTQPDQNASEETAEEEKKPTARKGTPKNGGVGILRTTRKEIWGLHTQKVGLSSS